MVTSYQRAVESSRSLVNQLSKLFSSTDISHTRAAELLDQIRAACMTAVTQDIESATTERVEDRLWNAHQTVNNYFRKALAQLKSGGNQKSVERRKLGADYLKFIKSSQVFYRSYVKELALAYGGIEELERVAQRLNKDYRSTCKAHTTALRELVLLSCHRTLIQLGDLSRYRETELAGKERNWAPATGYYDLAGVVYPSSGASHNQLAVMALADSNMFRATYHLYRALSTSEPYPQAEGNLRKAFYKIASAWNAGQLVRSISSQSSNDGNNHAIVAFYLRLVEQSYRGKAFSEREELEREIMSQMSVELKKRPLNSTLHKLVLTNMAAGNLAQEIFQEKAQTGDTAEAMQSYLYALHFNIRTFTTLLHLLSQDLFEVEAKFAGDETSMTSNGNATNKIGNVAQRVLPALRMYSIWLIKNSKLVATPVDESDAKVEELHQEFWRTYAKTLSQIANAFPTESLIAVQYMLEEEADTVSFMPLHCDETRDIWWNDSTTRPRREEVVSAPDIGAEMVARVRIILITGLQLAMARSTPLCFDEENYRFLSSNDKGPDLQEVNGSVGILSANPVQNNKNSPIPRTENEHQDRPTGLLERSEPDNQEADVERMVDNLVGEPNMDYVSTNMNNLGLDMSRTPVGDSFGPTIGTTSASSFPGGSYIAHDLLKVVQSYSQNTPPATSAKINGKPSSNRGSAASSRSRPQSQAQSPALNDQAVNIMGPPAPFTNQDNQRPNTIAKGGESPASPRTGSIKPPSRPGTGETPHTGGFSTPPSAIPSSTHTRIQSTDSYRSNGGSPWNTPVGLTHHRNASHDPWNSYPTPAPLNTATGTANTAYDADSGMSSSMLFGAGQSPWNMGGEERRRLSGGGNTGGGGGAKASPLPLSAESPRFVPATQYRNAMAAWSQAPGGASSKPTT